MANKNGDPFLIILKKADDIRQNIQQSRFSIIKKYPTWNKDTDARITILNNLYSFSEMVIIESYMLNELLDDSFYERKRLDLHPKAKAIINSHFFQSMRYTFGLDLFTTTESFLRIFLRALDPSACNNGKDDFINIYTCLFGPNQLNFKRYDYDRAKELLDLARLIRNTIHNLGQHFSKTGTTQTLNYRGGKYVFQDEQIIEFVSWKLLFVMMIDIHKLFIKIISHASISSIDSIIDPVAKNNTGFLKS